MHFYQVNENGVYAYAFGLVTKHAFGLITKHHSHQPHKNA
jgi:hypothetical protein